MTSDLAPVVMFAYKRLDHLQRMIESLSSNPESADTEVHVYCDGLKNPQDRAAVESVRRYVLTIAGFAAVHPVFRARNLGLAQSIISGVSELLREHAHVIVLEDDLVLSPHFLRYMNQALTRYERNERVASIHGYCYPVGSDLPETFFLRGADCWGWATWARAWRHFDADGQRLLSELRRRSLTTAFDLDGSFPYTAMLEDQVAGRNDSWAIRWHASCFLKELLTLYPGRSLVANIGNDSSGTHCGSTDAMGQGVSSEPVRVDAIAVEPSARAHEAFARFFSRQSSWKQRLRMSVRRALGAFA